MSDVGLYYLVAQGVFLRPLGHGVTIHEAAAGKFTRAEAHKHMSRPGSELSMIPVIMPPAGTVPKDYAAEMALQRHINAMKESLRSIIEDLKRGDTDEALEKAVEALYGKGT